MTPENAIKIYLISTCIDERSTLVDTDLVSLAEVYPDLTPVFEELQYLRAEVVALGDRIDDFESECNDLRAECD